MKQGRLQRRSVEGDHQEPSVGSEKYKIPIRPRPWPYPAAFHVTLSTNQQNKISSEVTKINLMKTKNNVTWTHYW